MTDPAIVIDLIEAFRRSKTMFAAQELGLFDRLASGPASLGEIVAFCGAAPEALERLLDACVGLGLLSKLDDAYANTPVASAYLTRSSPTTLAGYVDYSNRVLYKMWSHLEDAVREGTHRWPQAFGASGPIFNHFYATEEARRRFLLGMHGFGAISSPQVVAAFDLSRFRRMVDLGGATGHLVAAACERYPGLRGAVFDLPGVIPVAREVAPPLIDLIPGDFFTDPLPEADLYALGRILHDWSEDKIVALLARIHVALPAGGAVLIAEKLLAPDKSGPVSAHMQSLNMLICTEGKERTLEEYRTLLMASGFHSVEARPTGTPLDAILAFR
jgi:acetylserotonin N-methyltransferase